MKKVFVVLFVLFFVTLNQAFAYNVKDYSSDPTILAALRLLEQNGETDVFANLERNDVKIKFQMLSGYGQTVYAANMAMSSNSKITQKVGIARESLIDTIRNVSILESETSQTMDDTIMKIIVK